MAQIMHMLLDGYADVMENKSDQRVKNWFLMSSPFPTMAISIFYAIFMKKIGPKLMENRKPMELKKTIILYNAFQVLFSTWLFYEACISGWLTGYSYRCQPVDYSMNPKAVRMANGCWWYYISKFTEFLDTLFFVLRKKNDHISNLHIIHHGIMPFSCWWGVKFIPGGHSTFFGFLNTFVHIIMYTYYLFAALGPKYQKYLWWKKYLTVLQMGLFVAFIVAIKYSTSFGSDKRKQLIFYNNKYSNLYTCHFYFRIIQLQFVAVLLHSLQLLFIDCNYNKIFVWIIGGHAVLFYFLFSNFYKETYKKRQEKKLKDEENKTMKNKSIGVCFTNQSPLYESSEKSKTIQNGYTSTDTSNSLRNRVFINKEHGN